MSAEPKCGDGVVCSWMMMALGRSKAFRWDTCFKGESTATAAERPVLVVKLPHQRMREVVACPVCGGHPTKSAVAAQVSA